MLYIYKFTNKINGKIYIGQTNDIEQRKRGHKSTAFNEKSHDYHCAFHNAIRKYGLDNFDFEAAYSKQLNFVKTFSVSSNTADADVRTTNIDYQKVDKLATIDSRTYCIAYKQYGVNN